MLRRISQKEAVGRKIYSKLLGETSRYGSTHLYTCTNVQKSITYVTHSKSTTEEQAKSDVKSRGGRRILFKERRRRKRKTPREGCI